MKKTILTILISSSLFAGFIQQGQPAPAPAATPTVATQQVSSAAAPQQYTGGSLGAVANLKDNFSHLTVQQLEAQKIVGAKTSLINATSTTPDCQAFVRHGFTATVYDIEPVAGRVECMVAPVQINGDHALGDDDILHDTLLNPLGVFTTYYPSIAQKFKPDYKAAAASEQTAIASADADYSKLKATQRSIAKTTETGDSSAVQLNTTTLLLAGLLSDGQVIDFQGSLAANKIVLQPPYVDTISPTQSGDTQDNSELIKDNILSIFENASTIEAIAIWFSAAIFGFGVLWGMGGTLLSSTAARLEKKQHTTLKIIYIGTIIFGILFLFPYHSQSTGGQWTNKFSQFETKGYYYFNLAANKLTSAFIQNEFNDLERSFGITSRQTIIERAVLLKKYDQLKTYSDNYINQCNSIYQTSRIINLNDAAVFSNSPLTVYPSSLATVKAVFKNQLGGVWTPVSPYSSFLHFAASSSSAPGFYPRLAFSSCGKMFWKGERWKKLADDYRFAYFGYSPDGDQNIKVVQSLMKFEDSLYRDYGFLSILGLPIATLETSSLENRPSPELDQLNNQIGGNIAGRIFHSVLSSAPYSLIPGVSSIYPIMGGIGKVAAKATDIDKLPIIGNAIAGGISQGFKLGGGYLLAKLIMSLIPLLGILGFAMYRFVTIIIKIFTIHIASLFILPMAFVRQNSSTITSFSIKVFANMLELPLFVISVWLSVEAYMIINNLMHVFEKRLILGMLKNANTAAGNSFHWSDFLSLNFHWLNIGKIYLIDGFMEILVEVIALALAYTILIKFHTMVLELINVRGTEALDDGVQKISQLAGHLGQKV